MAPLLHRILNTRYFRPLGPCNTSRFHGSCIPLGGGKSRGARDAGEDSPGLLWRGLLTAPLLRPPGLQENAGKMPAPQPETQRREGSTNPLYAGIPFDFINALNVLVYLLSTSTLKISSY